MQKIAKIPKNGGIFLKFKYNFYKQFIEISDMSDKKNP